MPAMFSYPHRQKSGQITCYHNRTYHVLTTCVRISVDSAVTSCHHAGAPQSALSTTPITLRPHVTARPLASPRSSRRWLVDGRHWNGGASCVGTPAAEPSFQYHCCCFFRF